LEKTPSAVWPAQSGAKDTALQTLREFRSGSAIAKRLECGVFTAAFGQE